MKRDCIFFGEWKGLDGYCRTKDLFVGLTTCERCESYDNGENDGGKA